MLDKQAQYVLKLWETKQDLRVHIFMAMMCARTGMPLAEVLCKMQELVNAG